MGIRVNYLFIFHITLFLFCSWSHTASLVKSLFVLGMYLVLMSHFWLHWTRLEISQLHCQKIVFFISKETIRWSNLVESSNIRIMQSLLIGGDRNFGYITFRWKRMIWGKAMHLCMCLCLWECVHQSGQVIQQHRNGLLCVSWIPRLGLK